VECTANAGGCEELRLNEATLKMVEGGKPKKKKPKVPLLAAAQATSVSSQQLKLMSQQGYYTRHPHYPEVRLNTKMQQMTTSTMSTSNLSSNNDGGNFGGWMRDLSDSNSAIDEPTSHLPLPSPVQKVCSHLIFGSGPSLSE